jgi:hypothetical protein
MWLPRASIVALAGVALLQCEASSSGGSSCFPDADGTNNMPATVDLVVTDTGFYAGSPDSGADYDAGMQTVITTQNLSPITFTLTNQGTIEHGFEVDCASVLSVYPNLPSGCPSTACFPSSSTIAPIAPGTSTTVTFLTPAPDNVIFPFKSSAPGDANVSGLNGSNGSGWGLM